MPNKKISEFDAAGTIIGDELVPIVQGGANKIVTVDNLLYNIKTVDVSFTSTQILSIDGTDSSTWLEVIPTQGAGKLIQILDGVSIVTNATTGYSNSLYLHTGQTDQVANLVMGFSGSTPIIDGLEIYSFNKKIAANSSCTLRAASGSTGITGGDGGLTINLRYRVIEI